MTQSKWRANHNHFEDNAEHHKHQDKHRHHQRHWWGRHKKKRGKGISLLVPFKPDDGRREQTWEWLKKHWEDKLPYAEIIMGENHDTPWSKTKAVNDAASKATGDVFVILDADCYIQHHVIVDCAESIRLAVKLGLHMWYIPYRHFYRLTDFASWRVLTSSPWHPYRFSQPPPVWDVEPSSGNSHGHWFGALISIMPAAAFWKVGGMDQRFAGWGGEDVAFMRALDTLYGKHKTTPNDALHLWHPSNQSPDSASHRSWTGQADARSNDELAARYYGAIGNKLKMRWLVDEGRL